jgi:hypothetical protein
MTIARGSSVVEVGWLPRSYCLDADFGDCTHGGSNRDPTVIVGTAETAE